MSKYLNAVMISMKIGFGIFTSTYVLLLGRETLFIDKVNILESTIYYYLYIHKMLVFYSNTIIFV